jgi:hypothetical protein
VCDNIGVFVFAELKANGTSARAGVVRIIVRDHRHAGEIREPHKNLRLVLEMRRDRKLRRFSCRHEAPSKQNSFGMGWAIPRENSMQIIKCLDRFLGQRQAFFVGR